MKLWLVVPVKPFAEGKSRLAQVMQLSERVELSRQLLTGVLTTARSTGLLAGVLVVSRDQAVRAHARDLGCDVLVEGDPELNAALEQARRVVMRASADALLVLPSDLPLLTGDDIGALHRHGATGAGMVIAPSRDGGTNALLLRPPDLVPFAFGPNSFEQHCGLARAAGYRCTVVRRPTLAFDLDHPEDLRQLARIQPEGAPDGRIMPV